jgi:hypothetical protein
MNCDSCELIRINGVVCHEIGCPDKWKSETRECFECGFDFTPLTRWQSICPDCQRED